MPALTERERTTILAALRLDAALHDLPRAAVADALLVQTVFAHGRQHMDEETFLARCRERYRALAPGFALMDAVTP